MDERIIWVELLGVTMSGAVAPDGGLIWSGITGWSGLPPQRGQGDPIPGGHGRFKKKKIERDSRVITLIGHIYEIDNQALQATRDHIEAVWAEGIGTMRVSTEGGIWERDVEIDNVNFDDDRGRNWVRFTVDMIAPDPRRYGPVQFTSPVGLPVHLGGVRLPKRMPWNFGSTSGGSRMVVPNAGKIPVHPVITVTGGGFSKLTVVDITAARQLILQLPAVTSADVVLDSATHRVYVGGQEVTRLLTTRQWFEIPAGETHKFRFEAPGSLEARMWSKFQIGAW